MGTPSCSTVSRNTTAHRQQHLEDVSKVISFRAGKNGGSYDACWFTEIALLLKVFKLNWCIAVSRE